MDIDKNTTRILVFFNIIALILSIKFFVFKNCVVGFEFASDLFLSLFGSGVLVLLVSIISAQSKFKKSIENILFNSKRAKIYYNEIFYIDNSKFFTIADKIFECHKEFYNNYKEIEFMWFNEKYKEKIQKLFI